MLSFIAGMSLALLDNIQLKDRYVRVQDVVDMANVDLLLAANIGPKVIASQVNGRSYTDISRGEIISLLKKRVPMLTSIEEVNPAGNIRLHFPEIDRRVTGPDVNCFELSHSISAGNAVTQSDLKDVNCDKSRKIIRLSFDPQTNVVRTRNNFAAGQYLGRIKVPKDSFVDTGDELLLQVLIGPVKIQKRVWAMQPSHGAERIFVQDADQTVLSVPVLAPSNLSTTKRGGNSD